MDTWTCTLLAGVGATALTDAWALARRRLLGVPPPRWDHVGRWIGHMRHGRFRHAAIGSATPVARETTIGWGAHYLIGMSFAALLWLVAGSGWFSDPTPGPALAVGIATVLAPFLLMQPGMGAGLAARLAPRPGMARLHSLATHAVFGLGLYLAALLLRPLCAA